MEQGKNARPVRRLLRVLLLDAVTLIAALLLDGLLPAAGNGQGHPVPAALIVWMVVFGTVTAFALVRTVLQLLMSLKK